VTDTTPPRSGTTSPRSVPELVEGSYAGSVPELVEGAGVTAPGLGSVPELVEGSCPWGGALKVRRLDKLGDRGLGLGDRGLGLDDRGLG